MITQALLLKPFAKKSIFFYGTNIPRLRVND